MAIQGWNDAPDLAVEDIWEVWKASGIDAEELNDALGWPKDLIGTLNYDRESTAG